MTVPIDGIDAAASQEVSLHPKKANGSPITAWPRRATSLKAAVKEVNLLRAELDKLKGDLASRPF